MTAKHDQDLEHDHHIESIAERLEGARQQHYLGDAVLGAMDGTVTTFAVVSAVAGAGMGGGVAIVLGLANLVADGFSMAAGNYFRAKSDAEVVERARRMEERHIDLIPDGEREEVRQIFMRKGFAGELLEEIVRVITGDRKKWVNTMLTEELGLRLESPSPLRAAFTTFVAFSLAGFIPLLPLIVLRHMVVAHTFTYSALATLLTFFTIGVMRGHLLHLKRWRAGIEVLLIGGGASALAYGMGLLTRGFLH